MKNLGSMSVLEMMMLKQIIDDLKKEVVTERRHLSAKIRKIKKLETILGLNEQRMNERVKNMLDENN